MYVSIKFSWSQFVILLLIISATNPISAQIMDSTAATFEPTDYVPVPFAQLTDSPRDDNEAYRWTQVSGLREDLVKTRVFYTGQRRKTEQLNPTVLGAWVQARNLRARVNWFFTTEVEFTDGNKTIWLPVMSSALDKMKGAKPKGEIEIFVHRLDLAGTGSASIVMAIHPLSDPPAVIPSSTVTPDHRRYIRGSLNFFINEQPISLPLVLPSSLDTLASGKKVLNLKFESVHGIGRIRIENLVKAGLYDFQEIDILIPLENGGQGRVSSEGCKAEIERIDETNVSGNILCPAKSGYAPPDISFSAEMK